jgi:hypothetical protein
MDEEMIVKTLYKSKRIQILWWGYLDFAWNKWYSRKFRYWIIGPIEFRVFPANVQGGTNE